MDKKTSPRQRRDDSLSRERIIDAAIAILDSGGERGLTFQALSERLSTGPGAIYGHIANKADLLTAACDAIVARAVATQTRDTAPKDAIRTLALEIFDAMDAHPWAGSALIGAGGQMPIVRILEAIGQHMCLLGVADSARWATVSALVNYILGVSGQNAANAQRARSCGADRTEMLTTISHAWGQLDADTYPFTHSVAGQLREHDDRADYLTGVDLLLNGLAPARRRT